MAGYSLLLFPGAANGSAPSFTPPPRPSTFCTECGELSAGPPPDFILAIPPPPLPSFLQRAPAAAAASAPTAAPNASDGLLAGWSRSGTNDIEELVASVLGNETSQCSLLCDWTSGGGGVEYVELPRQGPVIDDTWFLILISSCIGILLIGALLALLILKCRDERNTKGSIPIDGSSSTTSSSTSTGSKSKAMMCSGGIGMVGGGGCGGMMGGCGQGVQMGGVVGRNGGMMACEPIMYPNTHNGTSRVLWAALTPRGTAAHFAVDHGTSVLPPIPNLMRGQPSPGIQMLQPQGRGVPGYISNKSHIHHSPPPPSHPPPPAPSMMAPEPPVTAPINGSVRPLYGATEDLRNTQTDTSPEYATIIYAAPTIRNEPGPGLIGHQQKLSFDNSGFIDSDDMPPDTPESYPLSDLEPTPTHTPSLEHRRNIRRPKVSSPTRIENPNLPPLNLMQHNRGSGSGSNSGTLGTGRRGMSTSSLRMKEDTTSTPMA
ncbi:WAS/WASL-interacting protein family member 1 [Ischnura elegans]|uniref:WAS/WASL-interacting protein family member 1 n=1 Tax=Ischnura elegans TaxID=197161 RepID=UPI001ED8B88D|nr:WAS/WASL-interacting protein family member 1 [Ischnura elegans]